MVHQERLQIQTQGRGFVDLTDRLREVVVRSGISAGLCSAFLRHTSAGLVIQENADPTVRNDLQRWIDHLAPEAPSYGDYAHADEGPDDMPGHLRAVLCRTSESVPVGGGRLLLGTWQALYLWEHRSGPHAREVIVTVMGER